MKTAVTVLQEMMVKMGQTPEYECIAQSGPQHQAMFDYRCIACGVVVTASARSKKEAKQEVARLMLQQLSVRGHQVPSPFGVSTSARGDPLMMAGSPADTRSYVALLKELCEEYRLSAVEYELVGDTGPPHLRHFTIKARIGQNERFATATTKKTARQHAAEKLYTYLRENLARVTRDFNEEDALIRAHEKAMERYQQGDEQSRRPDLGQQIAHYHAGVRARIDEETLAIAVAELEATDSLPPTEALRRMAAVLRLEAALDAGGLERAPAAPLWTLQLSPSAPELAFAAPDADAAAALALRYLRRALRPTRPTPTDTRLHPTT